MTKAANISISKLVSNTGQIPGLPKNPRLIKDDRFKKLVKSIQDDPEMLSLRECLVFPHGEKFVVIAGNMRLKACTELGHKEIPCKILDESTPIEKLKAITIKDNVPFGEHDFDLLANEWDLLDLSDWGLDFDFEKEVAQGLTDEDSVPEAPTEPKTKLGDIYQLGNHRLMCGDSTNILDVEKLMGGGKVDMVFTDPPYGIGFDKASQRIGKSKPYGAVLNDGSNQTAIDSFNLVSGHGIPLIFFWGANHYSNALPPSPCWIVWDKQGGKRVTYADVELCYSNIEAPARMFTHIWDGFRRDSEKGDKRTHPTQKPIELISSIWEFFEPQTKTAKLVLDLFGGSGSTLIACEKTGRKCLMMELDPKYCDVIIARWEQFSGKKAELINA